MMKVRVVLDLFWKFSYVEWNVVHPILIGTHSEFNRILFALLKDARIVPDNPTFLRPFFYYFGGKWMQARRYPKPEYPLIIEPFAGSAGYATRYYYKKLLLFEKDPLIAGLWKWLIKVSPAEIRRIPLLGADDTVDDLGNVAQEAKHLVGFRIVVATATPAK